MSNTAFRRLAWSNLAAQSAEQTSLAAVPMVAVLALGAGAAQTGLLSAAQTLPFLLMSIPAGLLADRHSRRNLLVAAEALRALSLFALAWLAFAGQLSIEWLALLGFVGATGTVAFSVAAPSLVPALVPREQLPGANARLEIARSIAFAGGPALAGALVGWAGGPPAFVFALALSCLAVATLRTLPDPPRPALPPRHVLHELPGPRRGLFESLGARLIWRHALLRPIMWTAVVWNITWFVLQAAYVPYAVTVLGLSAASVGSTLAAYGAGMVLGALLASRLMRALSFGSAVVVGPLFSAAAGLVMLATLWWPSGVLAAASFFLFGAGPVLWVVASTTLRQTVTPAPMLGRVSALFLTVNAGSRPVGAALGATIAALLPGRAGLEACLGVVALGFVVQALVIVASPLLRLQRLPEAVA
ncbi:MAG TPA: MFS transporter [Burkholderiaceae bacterium]|nr:MFS transporter [Burkholderiaceae bacterium]